MYQKEIPETINAIDDSKSYNSLSYTAKYSTKVTLITDRVS